MLFQTPHLRGFLTLLTIIYLLCGVFFDNPGINNSLNLIIDCKIHCFALLSAVRAVQVIKLQETLKQYTGNIDKYDYSSVSSGWTLSKEYGTSFWIKKITWDLTKWEAYARFSNDPS